MRFTLRYSFTVAIGVGLGVGHTSSKTAVPFMRKRTVHKPQAVAHSIILRADTINAWLRWLFVPGFLSQTNLNISPIIGGKWLRRTVLSVGHEGSSIDLLFLGAFVMLYAIVVDFLCFSSITLKNRSGAHGRGTCQHDECRRFEWCPVVVG